MTNLIRATFPASHAADPVADTMDHAQLQALGQQQKPPTGPTQVRLSSRDWSKPTGQQGLFHKFRVQRVDGSDRIGSKHYGCRYYVLDLTHDQHAPAAMRAYAAACRVTHPQLAADIEADFPALPTVLVAQTEDMEREGFEANMRAEGVENLTRRPSGRYDNMVLEWHWLGWRGRARAGAPS